MQITSQTVSHSCISKHMDWYINKDIQWCEQNKQLKCPSIGAPMVLCIVFKKPNTDLYF